MTEPTDAQNEAAVKAIEATPVMCDTYTMAGEDAEALAKAALLAAFQLSPAGERATMEQLKQRIETCLNDYLCEMKPDYDDSICGFNEAWDIVRKVFADALSPPQPTRPNAEHRAFVINLRSVAQRELANGYGELGHIIDAAANEIERLSAAQKCPTKDELAQVLYYNNYTAKRPWDQALEPYKSEAQADASAVYDFLIKRSQAGERE